MEHQRPAVHRTILVVDVEGFGDQRRTNQHRLAVRDAMYRALQQGFSNAGVPWADCYQESCGDGVFVLIPAEVPKGIFVESMPRELAEALRAHNEVHRVEERIRLRMALHAGEVYYDEHGVTAASVNLAFRLLDAGPLKAALADSPGTLALIVSSWFFDEVVRHSPAGDAATYRPVRVSVKETATVAWICRPDHPYPPDAQELAAALADTAMPVPRTAAVGVHGFSPALTSFVGRADAVEEVAGLLGEYRLVTVTGPGGVGKTRLAAEAARRVAGEFADGVWLAEMAAVREPDQVPTAVAGVLGIPQAAGLSVAASLAAALARQQLLLVLDNCEHVAGAAAELCTALLPAADDVRVLATSQEPLRVSGEARYRLPPLTLPGPDGRAEGSEAVALFADRARQADAHFALTGETGPLVARLVARLDGMPLAIELAAARVESLGLSQLLDRLDDRLVLLAGGDRLAAARHRSLAATVEWSYQLLGEDEQRVFRQLAIFPGPFTLEGAGTVAGATAGPVVLHLVDCSLLSPPRAGPDGRARYLMLETLRAYSAGRLADAGEQPGAAAALAQHVLQVTEQAGAGLQASTGELAATRWLDAEDATMHQALAWTLEHDPDAALRLAIALTPWWLLRGRAATGYPLLRVAAGHADRDGDAWPTAQYCLGQAASGTGDLTGALSHFTAFRDAVEARGPSPALVDALTGRSNCLLALGHPAKATEEARRALALARQIGYPTGEARALFHLCIAAQYTGDDETALAWIRQAQRIDPERIPGRLARQCSNALTVALLETEEVAAARSCADGLARARQAGDLYGLALCLDLMADLDRRAGRIPEAGAHLREALEIAARIGGRLRLRDCLDNCGQLCAATQRWAEAVTMWAAHAASLKENGLSDLPEEARRRQEPLRKAGQALGPARMRAAEERGAAMTLEIAAEFAIMLAGVDSPTPPGIHQLSGREQELVILAAQGLTDAQIAAQLRISVRTVRSHLNRIRDKTGCRRRADLTRLALKAGLV